MDRDAMVRNQRRRQVQEVLDDERGREAALAERLEEVVAETDGPPFDERVFERLDPEDVTRVREALEATLPFENDDEGWAADEIARLQGEIADSRRRQVAYERYLAALEA